MLNKNVLLCDTWLKMAKIQRFMLLVLCLSVYAFAFLSNTKFVNIGFVNYDINNHVFKEFQMFGGREMANCSQECILIVPGSISATSIRLSCVGLQMTVQILSLLWTFLLLVGTLSRYFSSLEHDLFYKLSIAVIIYLFENLNLVVYIL